MDVPRHFDHRRWRLIASVAMPAFVVWSALVIGLRPEHLIFAGLFLALFWMGRKSAWFAYLVLPFLLVGIAYDAMRLLLDLRGTIHIGDLYQAELSWFGVDTDTGRKILPEVFLEHPIVFFDAICGFAYITYLLEVFLFGAFLFFVDQSRLSRLAWAFLLVNLAGIATWILYPAAPPWYVELYGVGPAIMDAAPSAAGAARFDALIGINVFGAFYSRNANVFGAMPSLHCAYPTIVLCVAWTMGNKYRIPAALFALLVMFSAVYLGHHYVLDVIAGVLYGLAAFGAVSAVFARRAQVAPRTVELSIGGDEGAAR